MLTKSRTGATAFSHRNYFSFTHMKFGLSQLKSASPAWVIPVLTLVLVFIHGNQDAILSLLGVSAELKAEAIGLLDALVTLVAALFGIDLTKKDEPTQP